MRMPVLVVAFLLVLSAPAASQQPTPDSARIAAASELVDLLKLKEAQGIDMTEALAGFSGDNPMAAEMGKLMTEFMEEFAPWSKVRPEIVRIYADVFTESEIRELIAFYRTPIGQKMIDKTPELSKGMAQVTQKLLMPHMMELQQRMMSRIR